MSKKFVIKQLIFTIITGIVNFYFEKICFDFNPACTNTNNLFKGNVWDYIHM